MWHRIILPALLLLLSSTGCIGQKPQGPCLIIEGGATLSLGEITHLDNPEYRFVLRNTCSDTVRITGVEAGCSCTPVSVTGTTLPPGGEASIDLQFIPPRTTNGPVSKTISVFTEGDRVDRYVLRVEADIQSFFSVTPGHVDMDTLLTRQAATVTVRLTNLSSDSQEVVEVQGALSVEHRGHDGTAPPQVIPVDELEASPRAFILPPGGFRDITVRFVPAYGGKLMGSLVLYTLPETLQVEFSGVLISPQ
ncbi:MAG: DUF1573 domain-containing protein [Bacteroidetes bacterium]|nr:DUF1573 domain-containing protein [Bacteroidota bacterium]